MAKGAWTDTDDKRLLLAVISLSAAVRPKWDQVANMMGEGYTSESVRQHFQKLNKTSGGAAASGGGSDAPKTPSQRTPGKKAKDEYTGKPTSNKRKNAERDVNETAEVDDDEETPIKKCKEETDEFV